MYMLLSFLLKTIYIICIYETHEKNPSQYVDHEGCGIEETHRSVKNCRDQRGKYMLL